MKSKSSYSDKDDPPFVYGPAVSDDYYINRSSDEKRLMTNFKTCVNTILVSPRRYGKTSLVKKMCRQLTSKKLKVVYVDVYKCRDEYEFYNTFVESLLRQTSTKFEEWKNLAQGFLERLQPKITLSSDPLLDYSVSLGISKKTHSPEEVLELPEKIAEKNDWKMVVCIDEFQQIGEFSDSLAFQKQLRSVWQHHKKTCYCLFGSKKHLMDELFLKNNYPFYRFGDIIHLGKIPTDDWVNYICNRFALFGKEISKEFAVRIVEFVENNAAYVQQLASLTFYYTQKVAEENSLLAAMEDLLQQNLPLYTLAAESLTSYQMNFLRALVLGVHKEFGSADVREEFRLGSPANIGRIKEALIKQELILVNDYGYDFADPVFKKWFGRYCMM